MIMCLQTMMMKLQNDYSNYSPRSVRWNITRSSIILGAASWWILLPLFSSSQSDSLRVFSLLPSLPCFSRTERVRKVSRSLPPASSYTIHGYSREHRMITRWGNMSFLIYDYYFLFSCLIAGVDYNAEKWGKRESLNSFKSCERDPLVPPLTLSEELFSASGGAFDYN